MSVEKNHTVHPLIHTDIRYRMFVFYSGILVRMLFTLKTACKPERGEERIVSVAGAKPGLPEKRDYE